MTSTERALEGVIFDLDGTVTDTLSIAFSAFRAAVAEFTPHQFTDEELMRFFGPTEEGILRRILPHNWELCFERYLDEYTSRHVGCSAPFPGMTSVQLAVDPSKTSVRLRALYTGLSGRVLRSWGNPMADLMIEGGAARSDEAMLEAVVPIKEIDTKLAEHLHPMIASLFERFGVTGLSVDRVQGELERMKKNQFSSVRS